MTNVDELQAGRELDALVAEKVMGWINVRADGANLKGTTPDGNDYTAHVPCYSTDIAAAWQVLKAMHTMDGDYSFNFAKHLCDGEPAIYHRWDGFSAVSFVEDVLRDIAPLKICQAALKAVKDGP